MWLLRWQASEIVIKDGVCLLPVIYQGQPYTLVLSAANPLQPVEGYYSDARGEKYWHPPVLAGPLLSANHAKLFWHDTAS